MTEIKVSAIIPTHNAAAFIAETLKSAQTQTLDGIEIIVVDDASTDNTVSLVRDIAAADKRVKLIRLSHNQGVAVARNTGVQQATGQYVAFLDADDQWLPDKLAIQVAFMDAHHAKLGYGNYRLMDAQGNYVGERLIATESLNHQQMLRGNRIGLLTSIVDRQVALSHPFPQMRSEDYACWLSIARDGITAYRCGTELVAKYRVHANSTSANKIQAAKWTWTIYREFEHMNLIQASVAFFRYAVMAVTDHR